MIRSKRILLYCALMDDRVTAVLRGLKTIVCCSIGWAVCLMPALHSFGQNRAIDSLEKRLLVQQEDTNKALTLNRLSENYIDEGIWRKAMMYSNESILLSHKLNFKRIEGSAYENRGHAYRQQGDFKQAEKDLKTALQIRREIGDKRGIAQNYLSIGLFYYDQDNAPEALRYLNMAADLSQEINKPEGMALSYDLMGEVYLSQGNDSEAEKAKQLAAKAYERTSQQFEAGSSYWGIGNIQFSRNNFEGALLNYLKALDFRKKFGRFTSGLENVYLSIGDVYAAQGEQAFISGNKKLADDRFRSGLSYYDSVIRIVNSVDPSDEGRTITFTNSRIARIYLHQRRFAEARQFLDKYLALAEKFKSKSGLRDVYKTMSDLEFAQGNYRKAYEDYKLYVNYKDSIVNSDNTRKFLQAKLQGEYDKKDALAKANQAKRDLESQKSRDNQRTLIGILSAIAFSILIVALIQWRNNRQKGIINHQLGLQKQKAEQALIELKSVQAQLIQSEKMASLGELTAGIAHEIQNPLNFVNNFSEVNDELIGEMRSEIKEGRQHEADALAQSISENNLKITQHGKRADSIVKGMLEHSRTGGGQKQMTDINALAEEYINLAWHGIRARKSSLNIDMLKSFDKSSPQLNIVASDLGRVLLNLYNNAFYSVDAKSKSQPDAFQPAVMVKTSHNNNEVIIEIEDNGNGISTNIVNKIFQPFFTTKPAGQGTGLGLSLSYDIVKSMGGLIDVESRQGEYARFFVRLPMPTSG